VRDHQQAEDERLHAHHRLQDHHHATLIDAIGDDAPVRAQQQNRKRLYRNDQTQHRRRMG
jgi:hypothetical protein